MGEYRIDLNWLMYPHYELFTAITKEYFEEKIIKYDLDRGWKVIVYRRVEPPFQDIEQEVRNYEDLCSFIQKIKEMEQNETI